jgi:hypothetical protein
MIRFGLQFSLTHPNAPKYQNSHNLYACSKPLIGFAHLSRYVPRHDKRKKPTWWNTPRYSTTSAYSSTSPPQGGLPFA